MGLGSGISSVNVTDLAGLERGAEKLRELLSSATMADQAGLKQVPERAESTVSSVTMADQAGLKPVGADTPSEQGLSISKNCKICQVFLFLRPARSFFDQALGSPQAYIPALTAVWIHYSKFASECEFKGKRKGSESFRAFRHVKFNRCDFCFGEANLFLEILNQFSTLD